MTFNHDLDFSLLFHKCKRKARRKVLWSVFLICGFWTMGWVIQWNVICLRFCGKCSLFSKSYVRPCKEMVYNQMMKLSLPFQKDIHKKCSHSIGIVLLSLIRFQLVEVYSRNGRKIEVNCVCMQANDNACTILSMVDYFLSLHSHLISIYLFKLEMARNLCMSL